MMQALQQWSFARVLLISGGWVLLWVLAAVVWLLFQFRGLASAPSAGSGGIGAVSFGFSELLLAIPLLPPIVLILAWLTARWL